MKHEIVLTLEQQERFNEYLELQEKIKIDTAASEVIRKEIDQVVAESDAEDDQPVVMVVGNRTISYSAVAQNYKFNYDMASYINETKAYDTLTVSVANARRILSEANVNVYFSVEKGSRRISLK